MQWVYGFDFDPETGALTITYSDKEGDRAEVVSLGESCPSATLVVDSHTGVGVKLTIPAWHRAQKTIRLVRIIDLLGPQG